MLRAAALQFASGTDVEENLATCLRVIDKAAVEGAGLMVLPEFCNHISWYDDAAHARAVSLELDGPFLRAIAARAQSHHSYIVINVSLRGAADTLTVTSLCFDPSGQLCGRADKQTLMGHENTWFERAVVHGDIVEAPFGRFGMFPCRDGVTCETPRGLTLRGAQLFCDSLNSFALDEASLHVPARAPENRVFLVAANKVGPLIPKDLLQAVSEQTHIPIRFLNGAGGSQIVDPWGNVLARAQGDAEEVVVAELDLALSDDKHMPDGTDLLAARRPALYREIATEPSSPVQASAAAELGVACLAPQAKGELALQEIPALLAALPSETGLVVLPELFCYDQSNTLTLQEQCDLGERALASMTESLREYPCLSLCASLVRPLNEDGADGAAVTAVLINRDGIITEQPRLHRAGAAPELKLADELHLVDMPWGRLAILSGHDLLFPEVVKLAAIRGAQVLAVPCAFQQGWERQFGLLSRAAENRLCIVASSTSHYAGAILDLQRDFTLMTAWHKRDFDGYINAPLVTEQVPGESLTIACIHPRASNNKLMSEQTDLILDRPWRLSADLLLETEA
ncbi:Deaminated glutathione amidase [Halioglobus japonicus]|nr:Deaminated glutathione amidase [Halioglobus japonicus]